MMMTAVLAVALGLAPVKEDGTAQLVRIDEAQVSRLVGPYAQSVDRRGMTHLRGFDRLTGRPFHLTIDKGGHVEGTVGDWIVTFDVTEPG